MNEPYEFPDDDRPRRRRSPRGERQIAWRASSSRYVSGMFWVGQFNAVCGALILSYYWLLYETTTSGGPWGEKIHNVGLMNNRIVGAVFGAACLIYGVIWAGFGLALQRSQAPRAGDTIDRNDRHML